MDQEEIWKDIKGFEGLYQVSNFGRVKSLEKSWPIYLNNGVTIIKTRKSAILKQSLCLNGYLIVTLSKNWKPHSKRVNTIVWDHFGHTERTDGYEIDHIDENKINNKISNLQILTKRDNNIKSKRAKRGLLTGVTCIRKKHFTPKYIAHITVNKNKMYLGCYDTEQAAHDVYSNARKKYNV